MTQLLINLPNSLVDQLKSLIPVRHRSRYIEKLISEDLTKQDRELVEMAKAIENDDQINLLITDFDLLAGDCID
jgi:metal-responsive CopG/Arc/MetJ family transcriptional regulator